MDELDEARETISELRKWISNRYTGHHYDCALFTQCDSKPVDCSCGHDECLKPKEWEK